MKKKLLFLGLFSVMCFAEGGNGPDINKVKSRMLEMNSQRISMLNSESSCIQSASTIEAIKTCKMQTKQLLESKKEEIFQNRKNQESHSHEGRINVLSQTENCIQSAKTLEAYKNCEKTERASRQSLKSSL